MIVLSVEWCMHRPPPDAEPALGVIATWRDGDGYEAVHTFWMPGALLDIYRGRGAPFSIFDLLQSVLEQDKPARAMIAASRLGLMMRASNTRH